MIAKHVSMRSLGKSDFAKLVDYVTDSQNKTERLGPVRITNCQAGTVQAAISEVLATQHMNTRALGDKTYHLLVSFRVSENPSPDILKAIEERICAGLGYGDHQRISAVHHDTDNLHIHIAINKIHPTRGTMHEPFQAYRTLGQLCVVLERDYRLEKDNHEPRQRIAEGRAADMERHAGIESLIGWVQRECLDAIRGAHSWAELHQVLRDNGLHLRERGNGFVVEADDGTRVNASTLARDLSKPSLEARLGPFKAEPTRQGDTDPFRAYRKEPVRTRINTTELYARYKAERQHLTATKAEALAKARRSKDRAIEEAKKANRLRRSIIKVAGGKGMIKRTLYSQTRAALRSRLDTIHKQYARERQQIYQRFESYTWADWLQQKALQGNAEALAALRSRKGAGLKGNTFQATGQVKPLGAYVIDHITKQGTIIYRAGLSAVRDDGDKLQVSREATREGLQVALRLAMERYGGRITVNGTAEFKARILWAAADSQLPITFADPELERRRRELSIRAHQHDHPERQGQSDDRRGARRFAGGAAQEQRATRPLAGTDPRLADGSGKPNIGCLGQAPPPASQHRLRAMSELGVVRITHGTEMLLPSDVPHRLEQPGSQSAYPLRRSVSDISSQGGSQFANLTPAEKYIAEREGKRQQGISIPPHIPYNNYKGSLTFAGVRNIDGCPLALLKGSDEAGTIRVLPIQSASGFDLSRIKVGDSVVVTPWGGIKRSKGRGR